MSAVLLIVRMSESFRVAATDGRHPQIVACTVLDFGFALPIRVPNDGHGSARRQLQVWSVRNCQRRRIGLIGLS